MRRWGVIDQRWRSVITRDAFGSVGRRERLFAMSFLPTPADCRVHASMCSPGLGFDGFTDLDGNGKADILVAHGNWKTGGHQFHFIAEMPTEG